MEKLNIYSSFQCQMIFAKHFLLSILQTIVAYIYGNCEAFFQDLFKKYFFFIINVFTVTF